MTFKHINVAIFNTKNIFIKIILMLSIGFLGIQIAQAQEMVEIKGTILREDSLTPIYGAIIYNKSSYLGTLSNKIGNFKMRIKAGDTIAITHIGFISEVLVFKNLNFNTAEKFIISMKIRSYELPGIDIRRYRIRDKNREVPFTMKRTDNITYDAGAFSFEASPYFKNLPANPGSYYFMPTFGIPIGDWRAAKRLAQLAKVRQMEQADSTRRRINNKYNKELVTKLTGLKGNELEGFMNFCKPSDKDVYDASDYELTYIVLNCYEKFREETDE